MFRAVLPLDIWCVVIVLVMDLVIGVDAQDEGCYTSGSVAGIVIATIVVTLITGGLAIAFIWYIWNQRKAGAFEGDKDPEKNMTFYVPRDVGTSPEKQLISKDLSDYAFDNPYFRDDDAAEKGESRFRLDNGNATPLQNAKGMNGTSAQHKKCRPFSSLPFHSVFHPSGKKQKGTVDDTYISKHLERIIVPLRGKDFTGLGVNICGNMRDGIFVKDVQNRGPAVESGKIKAGDRIVSLTVSFGGMVYEDALTILSYASPYDVRLEIEKTPPTQRVPSASPKRMGASTSFRSNGQRRLFHPLYRSQSIDDLTQIGKDSALDENSPGLKAKDATKEPTPKRSQSVEASNGGLKSRITAFALKSSNEEPGSKPSRKSSTSSCDSSSKGVVAASQPPTEKKPEVIPKEETSAPVQKEVKSARFRVEQISVRTEAPPSKQAAPIKPARDMSIIEDKKSSEPVNQPRVKTQHSVQDAAATQEDKVDVVIEKAQPIEEADLGITDKPMAPPRKTSTPFKRRAPAPPPATTPTKTKTSAVVHRADEQNEDEMKTDSLNEDEAIAEIPPPPPTSELPDATPSIDKHDIAPPPPLTDCPPLSNQPSAIDIESSIANVKGYAPQPVSALPISPANQGKEADLTSSTTSSLSSGTSSTSDQMDKDEPSSPSKRKASSLGDLTKLEEVSRKNSTSSAILERAVSMDLQQSIPGETLEKQKKILKAPTFEDCCDEDIEVDGDDAQNLGLKRWENGLKEDVTELINGDVNHNTTDKNEARTLDEVDGIKSELETTPENSTTSRVSVTLKTIETLDVNMNSSLEEPCKNLDGSTRKYITSTPIRKIVDIRSVVKDPDNAAEEGTAADKENDESINSTIMHSKHVNSSSPMFSPVTISIPVIKPDLTHFEKLPSPPPISSPLDTSWKISKISTIDDSGKIQPIERISVQSLYRPLFGNKETTVDELAQSSSTMEPIDSSISFKSNETPLKGIETDSTSANSTNLNESIAILKLSESATTEMIESISNPIQFTETTTIINVNDSSETLVNGNISDSSDHYSTAQETTISSVDTNDNSTLFSVTLSPTISGTITPKTPNNVAGFAKTLIIPGPNEVDNLLSLAAEPNTPPAHLGKIPPIEKE